jgi:hypothetical protein
MHPFAGLLRELGSHLSQIEMYARKLGSMDGDSIDIAVGLPMESIWLTLKDDTVLERMFCDERYCITLTALLSRIHAILEMMYLPSRFITPDVQVYANRVARRIEDLLTGYAWRV